MLTRSQIQRLAQRHGIGAQTQERDYIQCVLLYLLSSRAQDFVFKGGTAIRIVYRGNRYSEDLDFNGSGEFESSKDAWRRVIQSIEYFGMSAQIRNEWKSGLGYSFDVSYQGPLYDGRDRSKGKIRVDISQRGEEVETSSVLVSTEYDDIRPFVLTVLTPEQIMAEKIRALLVRGKARDAYDIWLLGKQGIKVDQKLVASKLAIYNKSFTMLELDEALDKAGRDWERDLRPLIPQFIAWEVVAPQLKEIVEGSGD